MKNGRIKTMVVDDMTRDMMEKLTLRKETIFEVAYKLHELFIENKMNHAERVCCMALAQDALKLQKP